ERAVEIHLARREHAVEARLLAKTEFRSAGQLERTRFRPVAIFELLEQRVAQRGLDLGGGAPRRRDGASAVGARDCRTCERQRAVEPRRVLFHAQRAIRLDRERAIGWIDTDPQLRAAVLADAACRQTIAVTLAGGD